MRVAFRVWSLFILAHVFAPGCGSGQRAATDDGVAKRCAVALDHVFILDTAAARRNGPLRMGQPALISHLDVEHVECVLREFIAWHNSVHQGTRDSLAEATSYLIRPECIRRDWTGDYRQYVGERSGEGEVLIHVNLMCRKPVDIPRFPHDLSKEWMLVNDGGSCYIAATVDLDRSEVVRYSINGPYAPSGCQ